MKKMSFFPAFVMGAFFFSGVLTGCNDNGDSKNTSKDSTVIKTTDTMKTMVPKDTMMMDTTAMKTKMDKPIVNPKH